jgi:hypothetical protein
MHLGEILAYRYVLEFEERFDGDLLDASRWPHIRPQWSSRPQSAARYELASTLLWMKGPR